MVLVGLVVAASALTSNASGPAPVILHAGDAGKGRDATPTVTLRIGDAADTYVADRAKHKNFALSTHISASDRRGDAKVGYLRFALPRFDRDSLQSAHLVLTRDDHHLSGRVGVAEVNAGNWIASRITALRAPRLGRQLASAMTDRSTTSVSFDVTSAVHSASEVSFAVVSSSRTDTARFRSRESSRGRPVLVLVLDATGVTPPPSGSTTPAPPPTSTSAPSSSPAPSSTSASTTQSSSVPASPSTSSSAASQTTTAPAPSSSTSDPNDGCTVSALLVPSCGRWWGMAPKTFTNTPIERALPEVEDLTHQQYDVVHNYHVNDQLFPTPAERALALQPGHNRLLFLNWKPATDMTWAAVAAGGADARIDREASYINSTFNYPFFLTIWHEPENDVIETPGSGMTATDYAAMFRHVVLRLRADGVHNAVTVVTYMGYLGWENQPWFTDLYPGDDVVDWIAEDPYISTQQGQPTPSSDFNSLMQRSSSKFPGFYKWATTSHPGKPVMLAEWGVFEDDAGKAAFYDSVAREIQNYPALRAILYFDMPYCAGKVAGTSPYTGQTAVDAFEALRESPNIVAPTVTYGPGGSIPS